MDKPCFFDLDKTELAAKLTDWQEPAYRFGQIWQSVYKDLNFSPETFSTLSKTLRTRLAESYCFDPVIPDKVMNSEDRETSKLLFKLQDGKKIEAVLMRYLDRNTICISTQVGCPMNCAFCATGQMGFTRNLSRGEIVGQVMYFAKQLKDEGKKLTNIVVMGMGEPFHNYDAVMGAMSILNDAEGFQFGERRITISTVGIIPMIEKFTKAHKQINLAVSLHAPNDVIRQKIMPADRKYPMTELMDACRNYTEVTGRRITFEYALINKLNDSYENASELTHLLKGMLCHVNLIPLNSTDGYEFKGSPRERVNDFKMVLDRAHIPCSIRLKRGIEIGAGCGQLLSKEE